MLNVQYQRKNDENTWEKKHDSFYWYLKLRKTVEDIRGNFNWNEGGLCAVSFRANYWSDK